ncbi:MAG TPA: hypothetical protein VG672_26770, partial [Bryobacteraceae bacterium]|nr:hypothetical protein [Bryobacteraceae bacterium]
GPSVLGGLFYATAGFCGSTEWPQILAAAIWAPLVFLFLLRSLRGRSPIKDAAWAGVALGFSWLSGHHGPSLILTLAAVGVMAAYVLARRHHPRGILRLGTMLLTLALVSALQVLPAIEYGRQAVRWTGTGLLRWQDKVQFPEHTGAGLRAIDLLYVLMPEGVFYSDPFVGTVGASLAAFAVVAGLRRIEVRLFVLLGLAALFYAMAGHGVLYGPLYALCPLVEKSRSPIVALSVFHFSVAALAAIGAHLLLSRPDPVCLSRIPAMLAWFGGITFGIFAVLLYLRPTVSSTLAEADPRPATIALVALLLAWLYRSWGRGLVRRESMLAFLCLLLIVEQGNKVGWVWAHIRDSSRMSFIGPLYQTRDLAAFLRSRPGPFRVEVNPKDLAFNFGDWYGLETTGGYLPSILEQSHRLNWWQDRLL